MLIILLDRSYDLEENGVLKDDSKAFYYYYQKGFELNYPLCIYSLGISYELGLGEIEKDYSKAFEIIKECADKGHVAVIYDLGANFYFNGNGTEINYELADYYLNIAKENGLKRAMHLYEARSRKNNF